MKEFQHNIIAYQPKSEEKELNFQKLRSEIAPIFCGLLNTHKISFFLFGAEEVESKLHIHGVRITGKKNLEATRDLLKNELK